MAKKIPLNLTYALVTKTGKATLAFQSFLRQVATTVNVISDLGGTSDDITEGSTNKFISVADQTKLSGIETNATRDQSGAEIKSLYEAEADTNAFTDAEQTKLSGIETSADVTDTTNVAAAGALMSSNNLSDLGSAATARSNLNVDVSGTDNSTPVSLAGAPNYITLAGQVITRSLVDLSSHVTGSLPWTSVSDRKVVLNATIQDISTAGQIYVVSPFAGDITKVFTVINGTIATADATITPKIGGTAVTDGAVTIAFSGSAAGDVDSSTPSALNTVSAGGAIEIETDGASTNAVECVVSLEITL